MSERLTLQDLVDLLSDKQSITKKDAETFLREFIGLISETIEDKDFVRIKDFGTFKLTKVNSRRSVDVNTGDPIEIPAHYKLSFTPDKVLREGVNRPFSHFESILLDEKVEFEDKAKAEKGAKAKAIEEQINKEKVEAEKSIKLETPQYDAPTYDDVKKVEVEKVVAAKKEEPKAIVEEIESKVEKVLKKAPAVQEVQKEVITAKDLEKEGELSDINELLTKGLEGKKEVEPLVTSSDSSVLKETERTAQQMSSMYDDDDFIDYDYLAKQKKKRNLWIGIAAFLLILGIAGFWGYSNYGIEPAVIPYAQDNSQITVSDAEGNVLVTDQTELTADSESVGEEIDVDTENSNIAVEPIAEPAPVAITKGGKEVEVKTGQTMRALGLEYFGHGSFWVYIFEENRDKIDRPDAVYAGMTLVIPPASKYEIDANDRTSVRKAQRQEMKLFGEFSDK